jgi:hypothetical protein
VELDLVQELFTRYAKGEASRRKLAADLNERGNLSPSGKTWSGQSVRTILKNPIYCGDIIWNRRTHARFHRIAGKRAERQEHHKSERDGGRLTSWAPNAEQDWIAVRNHPLVKPLIDRATWDRCQEVAAAGDRMKNANGRRSPAFPYPLSGLVVCAKCDGKMNGTRSGARKARHYLCGSYVRHGSCECYMVNAEDLEYTVLRLLGEEYVPQLNEARFRAEVVRLLREQGAGQPTLDVDQLRRRQDRLHRKIESAVRNMGEVGLAVAKLVGEQIEGWSAEREALGDRIREAEVHVEGTLDVERSADEIVSTLYALEEANDAPALAKRELLQQVVERVELRFKTEVIGTTKKGKPKRRHRLVSGVIVAASMLVSAAGVLGVAGTFTGCSAPGEQSTTCVSLL